MADQGISVAVDVVVFAVPDGKFSALLVKMRRPPYEGRWALPGGLIGGYETVEQAAGRQLEEQTGLEDVYVEQVSTFSEPRRDPNGRCVSVAHMALVPAAQATLRSGEKYAGVAFFAVAELPRLPYDQDKIVAAAVERLRAKLEYTNVAYSLLPERFTLAELQAVYEAILGRPLDTRNFRKRMLDLQVVRETDDLRRGGAHRPARLYRFAVRKPTMIGRALT